MNLSNLAVSFSFFLIWPRRKSTVTTSASEQPIEDHHYLDFTSFFKYLKKGLLLRKVIASRTPSTLHIGERKTENNIYLTFNVLIKIKRSKTSRNFNEMILLLKQTLMNFRSFKYETFL